MFTIVVYDKKTKVVLLILPFRISGDVNIELPFGCLQHNKVSFAIFNGDVEPVLKENPDGDICFVENNYYFPKGLNLD